jgi:hypothetical protein
MEIMQQFLAYAGDFEKTLKDDDWTRLRQYFADDAVYEVRAASFGCRLSGCDAIFAGMKKSLDNFDRKFSRRRLELTGVPEIDTDEIRASWKVTYQQAGLPEYILEGRTTVRYSGDKIAYLGDAYDPSQDDYLAEYQRTNRVKLDPSYV